MLNCGLHLVSLAIPDGPEVLGDGLVAEELPVAGLGVSGVVGEGCFHLLDILQFLLVLVAGVVHPATTTTTTINTQVFTII